MTREIFNRDLNNENCEEFVQLEHYDNITAQNLPLAIFVGFITTLLCAFLLFGFSILTDMSYVFLTPGVGFLVGFFVQSSGKGADIKLGFAGALLTLLGCVLAKLFVTAYYMTYMNQSGIPIDIFTSYGFEFMIDMWKISFSYIDYLFYFGAMYYGYKYGITPHPKQTKQTTVTD